MFARLPMPRMYPDTGMVENYYMCACIYMDVTMDVCIWSPRVLGMARYAEGGHTYV